METSLSLYLTISSLILLLYKVVSLVNNIQAAKRTGLPYLVTPFLETEVPALLITPLLRKIYERRVLSGNGWPSWCRVIVKDWTWEDKRAIHDQYGDVFIAVSPEGLICYSADAAMGWDVMNRRNEFTKPRDKYKLLEIYGPNVATAEGKVYQHHVRITAPPFGDTSGANDLVWNETIRQSNYLCELWADGMDRDLEMDINALTLTVISFAGFGKAIDLKQNLQNEQETIPTGYSMSFLKAINDTTRHMVAILLFPAWLLRMSPRANAAIAHSQLDKYLRELLRAEKAQLEQDTNHQSKNARGNLLSSVVRNSVMDSTVSEKGFKRGFSEDEVMGNLFIYLLAGYETTANAILYGLIVLALNPHIQDQLSAEIDKTYAEAEQEGRNELTYLEDFPKLELCYGFMYESFRLYPGVVLITKVTETGANIKVFDPEKPAAPPQEHYLPPECRVYLNSPAIHYSSRYWADPSKLRLERWTSDGNTDDQGNDAPAVTASDRTRQMKGTLLTFSDGARACLGRKFAQSEYIAFLAVLLRSFKIHLGQGEDATAVKNMIDRASAGKVTLAPLKGVKMRFERR